LQLFVKLFWSCLCDVQMQALSAPHSGPLTACTHAGSGGKSFNASKSTILP
jgi:hypothetical protein